MEPYQSCFVGSFTRTRNPFVINLEWLVLLCEIRSFLVYTVLFALLSFLSGHVSILSCLRRATVEAFWSHVCVILVHRRKQDGGIVIVNLLA